jgi:hypothetical protein
MICFNIISVPEPHKLILGKSRRMSGEHLCLDVTPVSIVIPTCFFYHDASWHSISPFEKIMRNSSVAIDQVSRSEYFRRNPRWRELASHNNLKIMNETKTQAKKKEKEKSLRKELRKYLFKTRVINERNVYKQPWRWLNLRLLHDLQLEIHLSRRRGRRRRAAEESSRSMLIISSIRCQTRDWKQWVVAGERGDEKHTKQRRLV